MYINFPILRFPSSHIVSPFSSLPMASFPTRTRSSTTPAVELPQAAQRVPQATLLHTIYFKRVSYPLTSHPDALWVVEVDQDGRESWRTVEDFLYHLCPPMPPYELANLANSWRQFYGIAPLEDSRDDAQFPVLPQPAHSNFTTGRPTTWIPDHRSILQFCWGRSAHRFSQGNPSPSLLQPLVSSTPTRTTSGLSHQPESEPMAPHLRREPSALSDPSSNLMEVSHSDDCL